MTRTLNKTMKAVVIDQFGGIETLKTREIPVPEVDADEVLVRVEAAGVGVWDPFEREGGFAKEFNVKPTFPVVLGSDGAGIVEAVGSHVRGLNQGDRVYGISFLNPKGGFYAQYAAVKENSLSRIPGQLTTQQAAAMAVDAVTALAGLDSTLGLKKRRVDIDLRSQRRCWSHGRSISQPHGCTRACRRLGERRRRIRETSRRTQSHRWL